MADQEEENAVPIMVMSEDPPEKEKDVEQSKVAEKKAVADVDELSAEDQKLKETLELLVKTITEDSSLPDHEVIQRQALESLRKEIRSSTSSMTSIPKPLKFLGPHYETLTTFNQEKMAEGPNKIFMYDILSVLAMTMSETGSHQSLHFKLQGTVSDVGDWGHEYVRHLCGEIATEWQKLVEEEKSTSELSGLVDQILPFKLAHNGEFEGIDLLIDIEQVDRIPELCTSDNCQRLGKYVLACAEYLGDPDEQAKIRSVLLDIFLKFQAYSDAMRVAIKLERRDLMLRVFAAAGVKPPSSEDEEDEEDEEEKDMEKLLITRQLCYILARQHIVLTEFEDDDDMMEAMGNVGLNEHFLALAAELNVTEAKRPADIYKTHLIEGHGRARRRENKNANTNPTHDSAKKNLADTFVNAFLNAGFGEDLMVTPEGSDWLFKNRGHGMLSAAASVGLIHLWDLDTGFNAVDVFSLSTKVPIKAGGLLATGIISAGVSSEMDAALGLLSEHLEVDNKENLMKAAAVLGLGIAYAGTDREDVKEALVPLMMDDEQTFEVTALTCLSLGYVYLGTANVDAAETIIESFMDRTEEQLNDPLARLMCLGMGLLFLGQGEKCEGIIAACSVIAGPIVQYLTMTIRTCAFCGTGSVVEIQGMLAAIGERHGEEDEKQPLKGAHQGVAVLGIAMAAMGESLSSAMALRALDHILQYADVNVRRAVPLALAMLFISNPAVHVIDTLTKLSHDQDEQISQNAVLALGLVGAGTNNSRIATTLRTSAIFFAKEPNHLFLVRIAQGLLHMGKGLMSLNPFHSGGMLMDKVGMAGILTVLHMALVAKQTILADRHYLLYTLAMAIYPRMLQTLELDEAGTATAAPASVRVGMAVDTVGQAGNPRTITGFQTHTTPVLIGAKERAELATDEFIALTTVLEGFVVVKRNPDATKEEIL
jgi:26S proteasome regulatory subunit N1